MCELTDANRGVEWAFTNLSQVIFKYKDGIPSLSRVGEYRSVFFRSTSLVSVV